MEIERLGKRKWRGILGRAVGFNRVVRWIALMRRVLGELAVFYLPLDFEMWDMECTI
jgi:hypothetical protein